MRARTSLETCVCSGKKATSGLQLSKDARLHVCLWCFPDGAGPSGPFRQSLWSPKAGTTGSGGPAPSGKHHTSACKRALLLKHVFVPARKQHPGFNYRKMRACMCVYGVFRTERAPPGHSGRAFDCQKRELLARGGPPHPENTIVAHASAHFF